MSSDEMHAACAALAAAGVQPSANKLVAYLRAQGRKVGKRTALKFLKEALAQGEVCTPTPDAIVPVSSVPAPDPEAVPTSVPEAVPVEEPWKRPWQGSPLAPVVEHGALVAHPGAEANGGGPDPIAIAEHRLKEAESELIDSRDALLQAKLMLLAVGRVLVEGRLVGELLPGDELRQQAGEDALACAQHYYRACQVRDEARQQCEQLSQQQRRTQQESWVRSRKPHLAEAVDAWRAQYARAPSERDQAHARKELASAMQAWNYAVADAPYSSNGTH